MLKYCSTCNAETERYASGRCKPCHAISRAKWTAKNIDKWLAYRAEWRAANPDKNRDYRDAHIDKRRAAEHAWKSANPEKRRIHKQNRRAMKRAAGGKLSNNLSERLLKLQRGKCACCGKPLGDNYHLDHIMPLALGGTNEDSNIQLLRAECNLAKHAKHPGDFMRQRGFLI